ncbi:hypothetical protein NicSoilB4_27040 [Arthrobacter sp. NicSoilB4]|uniref:hypothetical protein n=1 Tax=Arthrobacter sp. NicSoilB4 TaxID=2830997 RepID=UPI001E7AADFF|nr:hypothetical protein NicSoilB4_27040 [Arthrobacter sp. NicSoilB4]
MFTTTHGLAGSVSECRGAAAAEGGGVVPGAVAAALPGEGSADGVALAVADGVAVKVVAGGAAAADDVGRTVPGEQALRAARPDPANSRRPKTRLLGVGLTESGASGCSADP